MVSVCLLAPTKSAHGEGVTLITHGLQLFQDYPGWVDRMAIAITNQAYANGKAMTWYHATVGMQGVLTKTPVLLPLVRKSEDAGQFPQGEIIITLDWSLPSNHLQTSGLPFTGISTDEIADALLPVFLDTYDNLGISIPLAALPLHFIGHSRGGSVVVELARLLGEKGVWVDHLTSLDPHPIDVPDYGTWLIPPDPAIKLYENVVFADDYWRRDPLWLFWNPILWADFNGEPVRYAYRVRLSESILHLEDPSPGITVEPNDEFNPGYSIEHSDVHLWYHATIGPPFSDNDGGATIGSYWFGGVHPKKTETGFYYSRLGGGVDDRPETGVFFKHRENGGVSRYFSQRKGSQWANISDITVPSAPFGLVQIGENISISYRYQDFDSGATIQWFLDTDSNPFNNSGATPIWTQPITSSGDGVAHGSCVRSSASVLPNTYWICAKITSANGGDDRYAYSPGSYSFSTAATFIPTPIITTLTPQIMPGLPLPQTQLLTITGTGFLQESKLEFFDNSTTYSGRTPTYVSPTELRYDVKVGNVASNWKVKVVNGSIKSPPASFIVAATPDNTAPSPPINLSAFPSPWSRNNLFWIGWDNPTDPSGIARVWWKLGSPPTTSTDGLSLAMALFNPLPITPTVSEGTQALYVWLEDGTGNRNHNNRATVNLGLDTTLPAVAITSPTSLISPDLPGWVLLYGTYSDSLSGVSSVRYLNSQGETGEATLDGGSTAGNWFLPGGLRLFPGLNTIVVTAIDFAGNQSSVTLPMNYFDSSNAGTVSVTITPQGAIDQGAQWRVNGGAWHNNGDSEISVPTGPRFVEFKAVPGGWRTPAGIVVNVSAGQTATGSGNYTPVFVNLPPNAPSNPTPANGASDLGRQQPVFSWSGSDPDGSIEFLFCLDPANPSNPNPPAYGAWSSASSFQYPATLLAGTTYNWRIKSRDNFGAATDGPVWRFTTAYSYADLVANGLAAAGTIEPGAQVALSVTVKNEGSFVSPGAYVHFYLSRSPGAKEIRLTPNVPDLVPQLQPAQQQAVSFLATLNGLVAGQSFIDAWIDSGPPGPFNEKNFENNIRSIELNYIDGKDPEVTALNLSNPFVKTGVANSIVYSAQDNVGLKTVDFYYSTDDGLNWTPIQEGYVPPSPPTYGALFAWTIPSSLPIGGVLKVRCVARDTSGNWGERIAGPYTILNGAAPSIAVVEPNGGEVWNMGTVQQIRWNVSSASPLQEIRVYFTHGAVTEFVTTISSPLSIAYSWTLPSNLATTTGKIRLQAWDVNGNMSEDWSDGFFTIRDSSTGPPPPWGNPLQITSPSNGDSGAGPRIATDAAGNLHMVYLTTTDTGFNPRTITQTIRYKRRTGSAWSAVQTVYSVTQVTDGALTGFYSLADLRVAVSPSGNPHAVWRSDYAGGITAGNQNDIFHTTSDGVTWSAPVNVSANVPDFPGVQTKSVLPCLQVDSSGTAHLVWVDGYYWNPDFTVSGVSTLYYRSRSPVTGWSSIVKLTTGYSYSPSMAIGGNGDIHLAFLSIPSGTASVTYMRKSGGDWSSLSVVASQVDDSIDIACSNGSSIHVTWLYYNSSTSKKDVRYSHFDGQSWSPYELVHGAGQARNASLIADGLDRPHVVWENNEWPYKLWHSLRVGNSWMNPIQVNLDSQIVIGDSADAAFAGLGSRLHAVWSSSVDGSAEIFYNSADVSFATDVFPPLVQVISPTGNGVVSVGSLLGIGWNANDNVGVTSVDLHYSTDGGATWAIIAQGESNDGSFTWTVSNIASTSCVVRVTAHDAAGNSGAAESGAFSVADLDAPSINLTGPVGGSSLTGGATANLGWIATDNVGVIGIDLEYSLDNGSSWSEIGIGLTNDGTEPWEVPNVATTSLVIRATARDAAGLTASTVSGSPLTINRQNTLPAVPHSPFPIDAGAGVPPGTGTLQWASSDVDGDPLTYEVRFGTDPNPPVLSSAVKSPSVSVALLRSQRTKRSVGLSSVGNSSEFTPSTLLPNTTYYWRVSVSDGSLTADGPLWSFTTAASTVLGRYIFYNRSAFDGNDPSANLSDDAAIATDKVPLLAGGTATFNNYTSYSRGINGIMVDIAGLGGTPTLSDFVFKVGNDNNSSGWPSAPSPLISVRSGAGVDGADRVTLIWPDGAIKKQWLQVTVKATANTGLAADDVFYFGNAVGEAGNSVANAQVDVTDVLRPFNRQSGGSTASITSVLDINRDTAVDVSDVLLPFNHQTDGTTALKLINLAGPSGLSGPSGESSQRAVALSAFELSELLRKGPDGNSVSGGSFTVHLSLQLVARRHGSDEVFLATPDAEGEWSLEVTDDVTRARWQSFPEAAWITPEGKGWLIPIPPDSETRFYRAVQNRPVGE